MRRSATTDSNGEYVLDSLEAGEETIMFSHAKHAPVRKQVTLKGRETRLDLQLTAGQKITGTVVTEGGAPVADAAVELRGGGFAHARTDASGTFELESVNAGRYTVVASKTGYAEGRVEDYDAASGAPLRIVMRTGGSIYGRVTGVSPKELAMVEVQAFGNRTQASASVDAQGNYRIDGAPTGSVQVHAMISPRATMGAGYRTTRSHTLQVEPGSSQQVDLEFRGDVTVRGRITRNGQVMRGGSIMFHPKASDQAAASGGTIDDQGQYSVTGLEDGVYDVSISDMQRGYAPYHTTYTVRGSGTFDVDYKMGMVRGRVLDAANGDPIANVSVQLRSTTTPDFRGLRGGVTDSTGAFVIDSVPPGTYTATATKDGYGNQVTELMVGESALDNVELRLARNDGVVLKVVDARDGRPIAAQIVVYDMQGRVVHESRMSFLMGGGADATELRIPVSPGAYTASVSAMNYAPRNISFQSPSTQSVALSPGGSLQVMSKHNVPRRVRLLDANGIAYPRYAWSITQARDLLPSPAATTYTNVAAGSYTLQLVDENNNVLESKQVVVQDGQTSTVEI
jgi:5-hydroxyisourate hydrolase-like protein (transthyretin family)